MSLKLSYKVKIDIFQYMYYHKTVEPRYKKVRYLTKPSHNRVILLVPALYISHFFPDITRKLIIKDKVQWNLFITRSLGP